VALRYERALATHFENIMLESIVAIDRDRHTAVAKSERGFTEHLGAAPHASPKS
jgi:hypothetical protein